jgi:hypothetical protein
LVLARDVVWQDYRGRRGGGGGRGGRGHGQESASRWTVSLRDWDSHQWPSSLACSAASATASSSWAARPQGTPPLTLSMPCRSSAPSGAYCSSVSTASRRGRPTSCSASCSSCLSPLSPCSWLRQVTGAHSELQLLFILCLQALPSCDSSSALCFPLHWNAHQGLR